MMYTGTAVFIAGAYLVGAIPFGLLFAKAMGGVDVRATGSGNIGATNVLRATGKKAALFTLLADCLKGLVPVLFAAHRAAADQGHGQHAGNDADRAW